METLLICAQRLPFFTFQSVLLSSHDVDQGALQRVQVEAVERPGSFLKGGESGERWLHRARQNTHRARQNTHAFIQRRFNISLEEPLKHDSV